MGKGNELAYFTPRGERKKILYENLPEKYPKLKMTLRAGFYENELSSIFSEIEKHADEDWDWQAKNIDFKRYTDFMFKFREEEFEHALEYVAYPMIYSLWFRSEKDRDVAKRILEPFAYNPVKDPTFVILEDEKDEDEEG